MYMVVPPAIDKYLYARSCLNSIQCLNVVTPLWLTEDSMFKICLQQEMLVLAFHLFKRQEPTWALRDHKRQENCIKVYSHRAGHCVYLRHTA